MQTQTETARFAGHKALKGSFMMTQSTLAARALLKEYWNFTIPISPKEYAENLGLLVVESDGLGANAGYLEAEKKRICINANVCPERKLFTIAHELGYFCLGHGSSRRDTTKADW